jgi:cytochrome c553
MKQLLLIASIAGLSLLGTALAAGDPEAGKTKSATCTACHGPDGNSIAPNFPKIAGQHEDYLLKQLMDYKAGNRVNATMTGMVAALNEQDMKDLAAYYATQKVTIGEADPTKVELGERIYRAGDQATGVSACAACHGPTGKGNPMANFPKLKGQHAQYTTDQLNYFRDGTRNNDAGAMMRSIAGRMSDEQIEAVAQYIQGLN